MVTTAVNVKTLGVNHPIPQQGPEVLQWMQQYKLQWMLEAQ
jgi:hypothetical protein